LAGGEKLIMFGYLAWGRPFFEREEKGRYGLNVYGENKGREE